MPSPQKKSLLEVQFPIGQRSLESYLERNARTGKILNSLGKWWGTKCIVLTRSAILGPLFETSDDPDRWPEDLEVFLKLLKEKVIIIDGPAGRGEVTRAILRVADVALIPCGPSVLDLRAASDAVRALEQVHRIRGEIPRAHSFPTSFRRTTACPKIYSSRP